MNILPRTTKLLRLPQSLFESHPHPYYAVNMAREPNTGPRLRCPWQIKAEASLYTPWTWGPLSVAVQRVHEGEAEGIGLVIWECPPHPDEAIARLDLPNARIFAVVLSDCFTDTGVPAPWARDILDYCHTYTELREDGRSLLLLCSRPPLSTRALRLPNETPSPTVPGVSLVTQGIVPLSGLRVEELPAEIDDGRSTSPAWWFTRYFVDGVMPPPVDFTPIVRWSYHPEREAFRPKHLPSPYPPKSS
jgi:hypothetical protein